MKIKQTNVKTYTMGIVLSNKYLEVNLYLEEKSKNTNHLKMRSVKNYIYLP